MFNMRKDIKDTNDMTITIIIVNKGIKIRRQDTKTNTDLNMMKGKSTITVRSLKCLKNQKLNPMKISWIKKLKNFKLKLRNSKNSESKKKTATRMGPKSLPIKSKHKNTISNLPKHALLSSTLTRITLIKISKISKTKSIITEKRLISSTNLLKNPLRSIKLKKWIIKNLSKRKTESLKKCQLKNLQKLRKLNFLPNWTKLKREKFKFQKKMSQSTKMMKNSMKSKVIKMPSKN